MCVSGNLSLDSFFRRRVHGISMMEMRIIFSTIVAIDNYQLSTTKQCWSNKARNCRIKIDAPYY